MIRAFTAAADMSGGVDVMTGRADAVSTHAARTSVGVIPGFTRVDGVGTGVNETDTRVNKVSPAPFRHPIRDTALEQR